MWITSVLEFIIEIIFAGCWAEDDIWRREVPDAQRPPCTERVHFDRAWKKYGKPERAAPSRVTRLRGKAEREAG